MLACEGDVRGEAELIKSASETHVFAVGMTAVCNDVAEIVLEISNIDLHEGGRSPASELEDF